MFRRHGKAVSQMIEKNCVLREQKKLEHLDESRQLKENLDEQRAHIRRIHNRKMAHLDRFDIDEKYKTQLRNKKIMF